MNTRTIFVALVAAAAIVTLLMRGPAPEALAQPLANVTAFSQDWATVTPGVALTRQPRAIALCDDGDDPPDADVYVVDAVPWQGSTAARMLMAEGAIYPVSPKMIEADDTTAPCILALY